MLNNQQQLKVNIKDLVNQMLKVPVKKELLLEIGLKMKIGEM